MGRSTSIAILGMGLIIVGMIQAQAAGPSGSTVGFVDLERTLFETSVGKRASDKFERARKRKQKELDRKQKSLKSQFAQLEKQKKVMKPSAYAQKRQEFEAKYMELQELYMKLERDLAGERAKLIKEVLNKAGPIIEKVAKDKGLSLVLDRGAVAWGDKSLDITGAVNKRLK